MPAPKIAAIHDLSGFGRCSLTIVMPVLAAMGLQCCPLPTAYLSTHTGGFSGNTFLDMTDAMAGAMAHWSSLSLTFDAIYTGFMGSVRQMELAAGFFPRAAFTVVDPVMGDHGKPYRTYTPEMCRAMGHLAQRADLITPNHTEAALLLQIPYESLRTGKAAETELLHRLSLDGSRSVVLTGVSLSPGKTGAACFDRDDGSIHLIQTDFVARSFHGTGDLFASVLTGSLVQGCRLAEAAARAAEFVRLCAAHTAPLHLPQREGIEFEPLLGRLAPGAAPMGGTAHV